MLEFCILSSGSRANCLVVSDGKTNIMVDCGLSAREAARRMSSVGIDPQSISAIIITHEHRDHIAGAFRFSRQSHAPLYLNHGTFQACSNAVAESGVEFQLFTTGTSFSIGDLTIDTTSIPHDASEPVALRVTNSASSLAIVTDLGHVPANMREFIRGAHGLVLESNHDPDLLHECPYPWDLKRRIAGPHGHLSNGTAAQLLNLILREEETLQVVIGAHVSEKSNHPELVFESLNRALESGRCSPEVVVANAQEPTRIFEITVAPSFGDEIADERIENGSEVLPT